MAHTPIHPPSVSRTWASSEVKMFRLCLLTLTFMCVFFVFLTCISDAHVGDGSHQHCSSCGDAAHSGACPPDDNFWVDLGKTIVSEFIPGASTVEKTFSTYPHSDRPYYTPFNALEEATREPLIGFMDGVIGLIEKPINWLGQFAE